MLKALPSSTPPAHPQATDEDSPPNNFLTYTITSASAFRNYFSIIMVEGYAGTTTRMNSQSIICLSMLLWMFGLAKLTFKLYNIAVVCHLTHIFTKL